MLNNWILKMFWIISVKSKIFNYRKLFSYATVNLIIGGVIN